MIGKEYRTNKDMIGEIIQRCGEMGERKKEERKKERERGREGATATFWSISGFLSLKAPPPSCAHYHQGETNSGQMIGEKVNNR